MKWRDRNAVWYKGNVCELEFNSRLTAFAAVFWNAEVSDADFRLWELSSYGGLLMSECPLTGCVRFECTGLQILRLTCGETRHERLRFVLRALETSKNQDGDSWRYVRLKWRKRLWSFFAGKGSKEVNGTIGISSKSQEVCPSCDSKNISLSWIHRKLKELEFLKKPSYARVLFLWAVQCYPRFWPK